MAKNKIKNSESVTVVTSHKKANIAVGIVVGIAALILIAVAVLCSVRVDPLDGLAKPERYELYDIDSASPLSTNAAEQSKISVAVSDMDFSIMSAVLQWNWDYSYNFVRNSAGDKIKMSAEEVVNVKANASSYMVEYIYKPVTINDGEIDYSTAQSLEVDGETIYFDRVKVLIGNTAGGVGEIYLYPYIYDRVTNQSAADGATYRSYSITAVKVRANTTTAYTALAELATANKNG